MAVNWLEPRDSTIFAGGFAEEDFFNSVYEFLEDKREQEEEQQARQRVDTILTQSDQEPVAKKLVKWRQFVTAGRDFVPINWDEELDSEDSSGTGKLARSARLKGEVGQGEGFPFEDFLPLADGFDLDWDDGRLDDTIEWATDSEDESAYEGEDLDEDSKEKIESEEQKESSDPSLPARRAVCTESQAEEINSTESLCSSSAETEATEDEAEADAKAEEVEQWLRYYLEAAWEGWGDEFLSAGKEELERQRRGECRKRLFESREIEFSCAAKRRCVERVNSLPVQQQNYDADKEVHNLLLSEELHLEGEESSGEGSCDIFVDCFDSFRSDLESELDDTTEWATAPEDESSAWETAQEDQLDDSVVSEEKAELETDKSPSFSVSLAAGEMESSASVSRLSCLADESSVEEEISAFGPSPQNSPEEGEEEEEEDASKTANPRRQVRKRKNIFTGLICAFIVKKFVNKFLLL